MNNSFKIKAHIQKLKTLSPQGSEPSLEEVVTQGRHANADVCWLELGTV